MFLSLNGVLYISPSRSVYNSNVLEGGKKSTRLFAVNKIQVDLLKHFFIYFFANWFAKTFSH